MIDPGTVRVTMPRSGIAVLTEFLTHMTHRPVLDETGLIGEYDIELDGKVAMAEPLPSDNPSAPPPPPGPPTSMDVSKGVQALGLRLEARRAPVEFLVVESAEKVPVGN